MRKIYISYKPLEITIGLYSLLNELKWELNRASKWNSNVRKVCPSHEYSYGGAATGEWEEFLSLICRADKRLSESPDATNVQQWQQRPNTRKNGRNRRDLRELLRLAEATGAHLLLHNTDYSQVTNSEEWECYTITTWKASSCEKIISCYPLSKPLVALWSNSVTNNSVSRVSTRSQKVPSVWYLLVGS